MGGDRLGGVWKPGDSSLLRYDVGIMTNGCMLEVQNRVLGLVVGVGFHNVSTATATAASVWAWIDGGKTWLGMTPRVSLWALLFEPCWVRVVIVLFFIFIFVVWSQLFLPRDYEFFIISI